MTSSQLRASARETLKGKWGKAALLTLVYWLIVYVITFALSLIPIVGPILQYVIILPLSYGFLVTFIKLKRNEEVGYIDFISIGFNNFNKIWAVMGNIILKLIAPLVLLVISVVVMILGGVATGAGVVINSLLTTASFSGVLIIGAILYFISIIYLFIKTYNYSLVYYILYDNSEKTGKEIVEESENLMKGNKWSLFWLGLTFIGWAILSVITLYVGLLWLMPYIMVTVVCFYESLAGTKNEVEIEPIQEK